MYDPHKINKYMYYIFVCLLIKLFQLLATITQRFLYWFNPHPTQESVVLGRSLSTKCKETHFA